MRTLKWYSFAFVLYSPLAPAEVSAILNTVLLPDNYTHSQLVMAGMQHGNQDIFIGEVRGGRLRICRYNSGVQGTLSKRAFTEFEGWVEKEGSGSAIKLQADYGTALVVLPGILLLFIAIALPPAIALVFGGVVIVLFSGFFLLTVQMERLALRRFLASTLQAVVRTTP